MGATAARPPGGRRGGGGGGGGGGWRGETAGPDTARNSPPLQEWEQLRAEEENEKSEDQPKVLATFDTRPGEVPRVVLVEREKRKFAAFQLTANLDSSMEQIEQSGGGLTVELFDDTEFESRELGDWCPPPGAMGKEVARATLDGLEWRPCGVMAFEGGDQGSEEAGRYLVRFRGEHDVHWVSRLRICFDMEDPGCYVQRVQKAVQLHRDAVAQLEHNLFIDSMPTDDIPPLSVEQINRILGYGLNSKRLKDKLMDTSQLINEVNIDFARTMNKIVFDEYSKKVKAEEAQSSEEGTRAGSLLGGGQLVALPDSSFSQTESIFARALSTPNDYPECNFPELFSEFSFQSFLTQPEVISTLLKVRAECLKIQKLNLLNTFLVKSSRLEEFEQLQMQACDQTCNLLKESWVQAIKSAVQNSLKDVGKGWYSIANISQEIYPSSKLKKLLKVVTFLMEETLRGLLEDSVSKFAEFIKNICPEAITVESPNSVAVTMKDRFTTKRQNIFALEINIVDGRMEYNTPLPHFVQGVRKVFDHVSTSIQNIPTIEPMIMENLFWSHTPMLTVAQSSFEKVDALKEETCACLALTVESLSEYLDTYSSYNEALEHDVQADVDGLLEAEDGVTSSILVKETQVCKEEHESIARLVPRIMAVTPFNVNCKNVKEFLLLQQETKLQLLNNLMASLPREKVQATCQKFEAIQAALRKKPTCPEDVDEMRQYMETVPAMVAELEVQLQEQESFYGALNTMCLNLSDADSQIYYTGHGWSVRVDALMEKTALSMEKEQAQYENEAKEQQEIFEGTLVNLEAIISNLSQYTDVSKLDYAANEVKQIGEQLKQAVADAALYNSHEVLFDKPQTDYSMLKGVSDTYQPYSDFWSTAASWKHSMDGWLTGPFVSLDAEEMEKRVNESWKTMYKVGKLFTVRGVPVCAANCEELRIEVEEFREKAPVISSLRSPGMRERHWVQISSELGQKMHPDEEFTLTMALEMGIVEHSENIIKICDVANKEYSIEQALLKMKNEWKDVELQVKEYRETETYIIKVEEQFMQQLDDHIVMTQSMSFSPYKKPFEEEIADWEKQLNLVSEVLDEWISLQRAWMYLEPIFSSPDIQHQLPLEGKRFANIDKVWRKTLSNAYASPHMITFCASSKLLDSFIEGNKMLDSVQKGLADYLETKRLAFSRFFFLSNDELLQILSQTKNPLAVQPHLRKCFEAVQSLDFADNLEISAMNSKEGERVPFAKTMFPEGNVEIWLGEVEERMRSSIHHQTKEAVESYPSAVRTEWVREWPAMVVLSGTAVYWCQGVEQAVESESLPEFFDKCVEDLTGLTDLVRGQLSGLERMTLSALITMDVHARDVTANLVEAKLSSTSAFEWVSQLRYYWKNKSGEQEDIWVDMVQASIVYGYEYLGNTPRLVVTPLTDRCYMTLMGAMHMNLGGAPAGPAGTGKTETTKDLAKALAKQCVVFNCSDGLDYLAMGKFFKGLASSGAWACFDEFNRIDLEVLSVVAQQILTIQMAIQQKLKRFVFEDTEISLNFACSVYITMNPGYAGRSELPDNLQALFRPCAMMVPDYALIAEICLYSYGYRDAKNLARKMVATFKLCSEQLSSQDHYDYGMRAVKSVITAAGNLKRDFPDDDEELLLLRGLRDVNVPKFLSHDLPLFSGIITDLFPGATPASVSYDELINAVKVACKEQKVQPVGSFLGKIIQLYETTIVRHGLMLVGPTMGAKSANYRVLASAMTALREQERFEKVHIVALNPKSITMGQLYGEFDPNTHEWTDGVLACYMRECSEDTKPDKKWIMFDGPVDAIWIENMNTVLDDNKKLCLVSGEIIQLSNQMTMMFEVEDLAVASPATVSRCGMVYMEPTALGIEPFLVSWLESLPGCIIGKQSLLAAMFRALVPELIRFVRKNLKETVATTDLNLVSSLFSLMDSMVKPHIRVEGEDPLTAEELKKLADIVGSLFLFSMVWSVGASCDKEGRLKFDKFIRETVALRCSKMVKPFMPPDSESVYEWCFDQESLEWVHWMDTIPPFECNPDLPFSEIIVPTPDTVRYTFLLDAFIKSEKHVLCVGETGTGKTLNVTSKLMTGLSDKLIPLFVTFSARTSANMTQDTIDGKLEKRRKGVFGPPTGKKFVMFVDDLNMPQREKYFAQPPIELLRQWMDHKGWYDRKPPCAFRNIVDLSMVASMGPPGGGRNPVTNRFLRHFNFISFTEMSDTNIAIIFNSILESFLAKSFPELQHLSKGIVQGSINVYNAVRTELLPTPAKSHYTFNIRDMSRVIQGTMRAHKKAITGNNGLLALWLHELQRVFKDRLINDQDREWFQDLQKKELTACCSTEWKDIMGETDRLVFCDFLIPGADPQIYQQVQSLNDLMKVVEESLEDYNSVSNKPMKLVMFLDAIEHVSRISRIVSSPKGNALLLGVGGSGRQSLTRLACYIQDFEVFQIEIAKGYGQIEWRDDLKTALMMAGKDGKETVFLFTDTQIQTESFLEDINNILNSGDVPNLYGNDDIEQINAAMRPLMTAAKLPITKMGMFAYYINRVQANLHIVLCFSPIGDMFRNRLRMFPSLVNCCTIDWFAEWPDEALQSVANYFLNDVDTSIGDQDVKAGIVSACQFIHQSVEGQTKVFYEQLRRHCYVTPTSYLELLNTFIKLLGEKRQEVGVMRDRLQTGLDKLGSTAKEVAVMQTELTDLQPVLAQTAKEVEDMMVIITRDKKEADETKKTVTQQEADASIQAQQAKEIAADAQADLDKALPALDAALESLKKLSRNDVVEVKSLKNPPDGVRLVMEACCIMFEEKPKMVADPNKIGKKIADYWEPAQKLLVDPTKFLRNLMEYDKDNIPDAVITKIAPYIDMETFTPEAISKVSKACTSICMWARAMYIYHNVTLQVAPKRAALEEAQAKLAKTTAELQEAQEKLRKVEEKIAVLEKDFSEAMAKKEALAQQVEDCTIKLERAEKLIGGLGGEKVRWTETVEQLSKDLINVMGDVIISAGTIAYSGPFTPQFRSTLCKEWAGELNQLKVPHTPGTTIVACLQDPVKIRAWNIAGLPMDTVSVENAIIVSKARRWPLMIDPQGQANKWIKNMEKERGIDVVKLTDKDYLRTLENGVRFGRAVLLENIAEELDAALEPLLLRLTFKQGGNEVIKIGDNVIPYHQDFRFYITTKLRNPHYAPEVSVKVSLLNFFVTLEGLEDQLLGIVVTEERPDLAEMKNQLVVSNARMKKELKEIEDKILYLLSASEGNILDDETLINTLAQSKVTSNEITAKVVEAEKTEKEIDATRELYRPVAIRASLLFFCISDLALVDPMYQYSLAWFIELFVRSIGAADKSDNVEERGNILNAHFTYSLYNMICRSLFERHKLMFSLLLTIKILQNEGQIDPVEWRFLLAGAMSTETSMPNPASEWLTEESWVEILNLSNQCKNFDGFAQDFAMNIDLYKNLFEASDAHKQPFSEKYKDLSSFQRLCVLRCLRADKLLLGVQDFISSEIGAKFIEPPPYDLKECYKESTCTTPLIFVLSTGTDPMADLLSLATELKFLKKFEAVSLGQGQGPKAERLLQNGMDRGLWICLQNCHLSVSWMPTLERIVEEMEPEKVHKDFRLWLTSMPSPSFPAQVLQNGIKITLEPPKGLKGNLARSFAKINDTFIDECKKPEEFRKILLGLCLFHAVIQERRKFGPLGWNIRYGFTDGDLMAGQKQLQMFLDEYDVTPFKVIRFLCSEINYGGRVTDDKDRRLINNLLYRFCNEDVANMDGYSFSDSGTYKVPAMENIADCKNYIKSLPLVPRPEVFGLHDNADITCDRNEGYEVLATVLSLQPRQSAGAGLSREEVITKTAEDMKSKTPPAYDIEAVSLKFPTSYRESMNTVLTQECTRYNSLLQVMATTLASGIKALKGLVVMSPELEAVTNAIFDNRVPESWAAKSYPSLKPLSSWMSDLLERTRFISDWIEKGIPPVYWISGFFFPQAFLTGTLQNYARKMTLPIDSVGFKFVVEDTLTRDTCAVGPDDGCYIRGLYFEGARWSYEKHTITESRPKELFTDMPFIWLKPEEQSGAASSEGIYTCPVYKTLTRAGTLSTTGHSTNFVIYMDIPSDKPQSHWINRGVALFCALAF